MIKLENLTVRDYLKVLLLLAPIAFLGRSSLGDVPVFILSALALIPLAELVGEATEEIAHYIGQKWGGLLNATLGNAAELIITIFAISAGRLELVRASIIGSIIGNLLLVMGLALLLGGIKNGIQKFDRHTASLNAILVVLAMFALLIPSLFDEVVLGHVDLEVHETSAVDVEEAPVDTEVVEEDTASADQDALAAIETDEENEDDESALRRELFFSEGIALILILVYGAMIYYDFQSRDKVATSHEPAETHHVKWSMRFALGVMVASVIGIVLMAETLVHAVEGVTHELGLSEIFIGIIVVPLVGNVAEHLVAVQVAYKNKMDLSMAIALGSSIQVALFVAPVLVFISLLFDDKLLLVFNEPELIALGVSSFIAALVAQDGESNWLEGAMLIAVYAILGLAFFFIPA